MAVKATNFGLKQVTVMEVTPAKGTVQCQDTEGQYIEASLSMHRTGIRPQVGQSWLVDRELTSWALCALLDRSPLPSPSLCFTTAAERDLWLPGPRRGTLVWLDDSAEYWQYNGASWVPLISVAGVWQTPTSYGAHWGAGSIFGGLGGDGLQYQITADRNLWLSGLALASTGAATTILNLPPGYRPASGTPHGQVGRQSGGAIVTPQEIAITTAGDVIVSVVPSNGDVFSFNFRVPLRLP